MCRFSLSIGLTLVLGVELAYWAVRASRRVRGDSYYIPLATRWLRILAATKLVSCVVGVATLSAGTSVVPIFGPRAVWNALKGVLGVSDFIFGRIDVSPTPYRPGAMPMLIICTIAATWLSPVLAFIFIWFHLYTSGDSNNLCLSALSSEDQVWLAVDASSLFILPLVDYIGGGMARDGAPMCFRDHTKAQHPRLAFGRTGGASAKHTAEITLSHNLDLVASALATWQPEPIAVEVLHLKARRRSMAGGRRHSLPARIDTYRGAYDFGGPTTTAPSDNPAPVDTASARSAHTGQTSTTDARSFRHRRSPRRSVAGTSDTTASHQRVGGSLPGSGRTSPRHFSPLHRHSPAGRASRTSRGSPLLHAEVADEGGVGGGGGHQPVLRLAANSQRSTVSGGSWGSGVHPRVPNTEAGPGSTRSRGMLTTGTSGSTASDRVGVARQHIRPARAVEDTQPPMPGVVAE